MFFNSFRLSEFFFNFSFCDAPVAGQWNTQEPATPVMEGMVEFHEFLMSNILFIGVVVFFLLGWILFNFNSDRHPEPIVFSHHNLLEIIWTMIPALILIIIAVPSFTLLYALDEVVDPSVTVKVIGHQWYWSYQYSDYVTADNESVDISFDAYQLNDQSARDVNFFIPSDKLVEEVIVEDLLEAPFITDDIINDEISNDDIITDEIITDEIISDESLIDIEPSFEREEGALGYYRLLDCDNRVVLPVRQHIRFLITSSDVLHSWAVPSFGIKLDACPGRLSQVTAFVKRVGLFFGQCSELCGVNHAFMPIAIVVTDLDSYADWVQFSVAMSEAYRPEDVVINTEKI